MELSKADKTIDPEVQKEIMLTHFNELYDYYKEKKDWLDRLSPQERSQVPAQVKNEINSNLDILESAAKNHLLIITSGELEKTEQGRPPFFRMK